MMPIIKSFPSLDLNALDRINVVGTSGVGKTTFSRRLAEVLDIPCIEIDALFWRPNWTEAPDEEFFPLLAEKLTGETWVLDGNYTRTTPIKWRCVQTVIWLDYSFLRTVYQAVIRATTRAWTKEELWPNTGNHGSFRTTFFSRDSIILWTMTTFYRRRRNYTALIENDAYPEIHFMRLRSPRRSRAFLAHAEGLVAGA